MNKIVFTAVVFIFLFGCQSSSKTEKQYKKDLFAMNTYMNLTVYGENAEAVLEKAAAEIQRLDSLWSVTNSESEISSINLKKECFAAEDTLAIIKIAKEVAEATGNAFDISVYPIVKAWGFTMGSYRVPSDDELAALLPNVGSDFIEIDGSKITLCNQKTEIDLGGIAKGYASQKVIELFREFGVKSAIVSLGGNVQTLGCKPDGSNWRIALKHPLDENSIIATLYVAEKAVITSGAYQRYFEQDGKNYHHIIDPLSGKPTENSLASVTIVSDNGALADALSTAVFVMGFEKGVDFWKSEVYDFDMILVTDDGMITISEGLINCFESEFDFDVISK